MFFRAPTVCADDLTRHFFPLLSYALLRLILLAVGVEQTPFRFNVPSGCLMSLSFSVALWIRVF